MNKQRMIKLLQDTKEAVKAADIVGSNDAKAGLIGQLMLASAIEESGSSISMSLDKLEGLALELGGIATAISRNS